MALGLTRVLLQVLGHNCVVLLDGIRVACKYVISLLSLQFFGLSIGFLVNTPKPLNPMSDGENDINRFSIALESALSNFQVQNPISKGSSLIRKVKICLVSRFSSFKHFIKFYPT